MADDTTLIDPVAPTPEDDSVAHDGDHRPTHIVGIGASAGGLEALERLFEKMPTATGLAFVVVQHLSPDFKSLTNELLARRTAIPIHQVQDGMVVEADAIYLLPPKKDMIASNGRLLLSDKDPIQLVALPIDYFFRSLAQDAGERAVGIILSGTGSDGSRGIRDIHDAGGLVLVQEPESAKFDGMPKSALNTGVVDASTPPEEIPQTLLRYVNHPLAAPTVEQPEQAPERGMDAVFHLLRDAYDIDFAHYKPTTVTRRTERRLLLSGASSLDQYVEALRRDSEELNALYKDLLIGVTRFFRDREAYDTLSRSVLPSLLQQSSHEGEFRVWVAACATGEEAYSLAILISEQMELRQKSIPVRIFATDVHRHSLEVASSGVYPEASLGDVSPQRLQRYFVRRGEGYAVTPELRKMVVFAQHNVIKDAPFTKIDLITCRNLLIYFQPGTQKKVLSLFHFGLRTGGILWLGPSESPGELEEEFEALDGHWHIYRKRRDIRLPAELRIAGIGGSRTNLVPPPSPPGILESQLAGSYDALLEAFMPPSLLVTEGRQLIQTFGGANRYLRLKDGRFSNDVLDLVDAELHMALTGALPRALKDMRPMVYKGIRVQLPEGERLVNLTVRPIEDRRARTIHALISLEDTGPVASAQSPEEVALGAASREHVQSLETELRYTKENLQATIEELETSNEELQATNEELVASNEELQSTNEELHSVNEELYTVNAEYQRKIGELTELTADMDNLLASTDVHTVFLDRKLCIRKFTPKIGEAFNLMPQDLGRRIDNFTHSIDHPGLLDDLRSVLETTTAVERPVRDHSGRSYLLRILPYRNGGSNDGVVLTLVDITSLRRAEAAASRMQQQLTSILRNSPSLVTIKELDGRYLAASDAFRRLVNRDDYVGKTAFDLFPEETARSLTEQGKRALSEGQSVEAEITVPRPEGPHIYLSVQFPLHDEEGRVNAIGGIQTDITQLKQAEASSREAVHQRDRFLAMLSHELRNPLMATVNSLALLERQPEPLPEEADHCFQVIRRRVRHMARLLDDLLDVARIAQNKLGIRKEVLDLATTVAGALEEVRTTFEDRQVSLTVDPVPGPLPVCGDPARLQQLQVNLLLNAAKYTPPGGTTQYSVRREGNEVVIRVRDSGVGMSPELLERVFELFVQANRDVDPANGGMGVGLSLVRSIVTLHGGRVQAFSDGLGQGCEFVVWLPLSREEVPAPTAPPAECDGATVDGKASRLLLVEDDEDNRNSLRVLLEMDGFEVTAVGDGKAALAALQKARADIAIIDLGLPGMDGCEVARQIRQRYGRDGIRLAALTGYGQASDRQETRAAGFDVHMTKPLEPDELYRVLHAMRDGQWYPEEQR